MNRALGCLVACGWLASSLVNCKVDEAPVAGDEQRVSLDDHAKNDNPSNDPAPARDPNDPFFARHPRTGMLELSTGRTIETPWRAQDVDMWNLLSIADADAIEAVMTGSGYKPFTSIVAGHRVGVVRVVSIQYRDTDDGPYKAFVVSIDSYKDDGGSAKTFAWTNPYSVLVPGYSGALQYFFRGSVTGNHVPTAREYLGLDKRLGSVEIATEGAANALQTRTTSALDGDGRQIAMLHATLDPRPAAQLTEANELAHAFGLAEASQLPPAQEQLLFPGASTVDGRVMSHDAWYTWNVSLSRWSDKDSLVFSDASEFGRIARELHIEPQIVAVDPHLKMAITPH